MEAQQLTELIEKLIDKKIERGQIGGKDIPLRAQENEREISEIKARLTALLQPLFT